MESKLERIFYVKNLNILYSSFVFCGRCLKREALQGVPFSVAQVVVVRRTGRTAPYPNRRQRPGCPKM